MRALYGLLMVLVMAPASAAEITRPGWESQVTSLQYLELVDAVKVAAGDHGMGVVTEAGPTGVARSRGVEIPGNRVIGLFNNVFAVRILGLSTAAMIEAPIRMYVTENTDGTATLSYKTPSYVLAPYIDEGGADLASAAVELDGIFAAIAAQAAGS